MDLFKKSKIVGISVTPEIGLEIAEIDYETKTVLKYGTRPLDYNTASRQIADMDIFKETLQDLLLEMEIPTSSMIVLNIPTVTFKVSSYPAHLDEFQIDNAISEELLSIPFFESEEPCFSSVKMPDSSMQFSKIAYTAAQHRIVSEIVLAIRDLNYKIYAIDTSLNSTFNALRYIGHLNNVEQDTPWTMLVVDSFSCRILRMIGTSFTDVYEEKISIGQVLGDVENYNTVVSTVQPILNNLPSKFLLVVSKTNIISAEILSEKLNYSSPIIHQEANNYLSEVLLPISEDVNPELAKTISFDVIGAAVRREIEHISDANFNLYNRQLGDLFLKDQPPEVTIGNRKYILSNEFLIKTFAIFAVVVLLVIVLPIYIFLCAAIGKKQADIADLDQKIAVIDQYLKEHDYLSSNEFDEGDEIKIGLVRNKGIYSYYTIVGTEIPKKLWLTHLKLSDKVTIEGQADNLQSIYAFFRSIKDYDSKSDVKLQKLGLASKSSTIVNENSSFDTESILTSFNADFYEFRISNEPEVSDDSSNKESGDLPNLEPIKDTN